MVLSFTNTISHHSDREAGISIADVASYRLFKIARAGAPSLL